MTDSGERCEQEMGDSGKFKVGDRVRMLTNIWDDGQDHHPPGYLAHKNEVLFAVLIRAMNTRC